MTGLVEWLRAAMDEEDWRVRRALVTLVHDESRAPWLQRQRVARAHREIFGRHQPRPIMNNDGVRVIGIECSACVDGFDRYAEELERVDWPCPDVLSLAGIYWESFPGFDPSWIGEP